MEYSIKNDCLWDLGLLESNKKSCRGQIQLQIISSNRNLPGVWLGACMTQVKKQQKSAVIRNTFLKGVIENLQ